MIKGFTGEHRFLSNFYPCIVKYDGVEYPTAEHAYQAAKTDLPFFKRAIKEAPTPGEAKKIGRKAPLRKDWEGIREKVMFEIILDKFSREPLRSLLWDTGLSYLEETNSWGDTFWGVCEEVGKNRLGFLLMRVRDHL